MVLSPFKALSGTPETGLFAWPFVRFVRHWGIEPIAVKLGTYVAKIYRLRPKPSLYTVCWYEGQKRRRSFSGLDTVKAEAAAIAQKLSEGQVKLTQIPDERP